MTRASWLSFIIRVESTEAGMDRHVSSILLLVLLLITPVAQEGLRVDLGEYPLIVIVCCGHEQSNPEKLDAMVTESSLVEEIGLFIWYNNAAPRIDVPELRPALVVIDAGGPSDAGNAAEPSA
jgi:hypothetical protein